MVTNNRLTRDDWVTAARKAFIASGVDDVKVDVLARRMKVTRGSFYWHFKHRQDLLDALLSDWEATNRREISAIEARASEAGTALVELFRVWLDEDPAFPSFDIAIRVWARKARPVANLVRQVDQSWIALFQTCLERGGMVAPESFVRARVMYFHQIGYFALSIEESRAERVKLAPFYYEALIGSSAPEGLVEALEQAQKTKGRSRASRFQTKRDVPAALEPSPTRIGGLAAR